MRRVKSKERPPNDKQRAEMRQRDQIKVARFKALMWTKNQAERLGITGDEILAAVGRGWISERIEGLPASRVDELAGRPPMVE